MSLFLIAEIGINHNGSVDQLYKLCELACVNGADIVKFQYFDAKKCLVTLQILLFKKTIVGKFPTNKGGIKAHSSCPFSELNAWSMPSLPPT